jgi:hypothetical protein
VKTYTTRSEIIFNEAPSPIFSMIFRESFYAADEMFDLIYYAAFYTTNELMRLFFLSSQINTMILFFFPSMDQMERRKLPFLAVSLNKSI